MLLLLPALAASLTPGAPGERIRVMIVEPPGAAHIVIHGDGLGPIRGRGRVWLLEAHAPGGGRGRYCACDEQRECCRHGSASEVPLS